MSSLGLRHQPDIGKAVQEAAIESLEERIFRVLDEQMESESGTVFVRPQCTIATMLVSQRVAVGQQPIVVVCPKDELRRAQMPGLLQQENVDRVTLFPLTAENHQFFLVDINHGKYHYGEHIAYVLSNAGWQGQEYGTMG
jgi:hypothetical protein